MTGFETIPDDEAPIAGKKTQLHRHLLRPALDAAAALMIFAVASLTLACAPSSASPTGPSLTAALSQPATPNAITAPSGAQTLTFVSGRSADTQSALASHTSRQAAWSILGLGFSLLAALNLAFFRHLRHAYADPRKRQNLG